tara:strand:+ start:476 stop:706 length:231 start_codon:yes stop_codon:yes gene_type:complete
MDDNDYNGWTNQATWSVSSWLGNDQYLYKMVLSLKMTDASQFENFCRYVWNGKTPDGHELDNVNWLEIADTWSHQK